MKATRVSGGRFTDICSCYRRAGRPIAELGSPDRSGRIAVVADGARVLALAFSPDEESVLLSNPELERMAGEGLSPVALPGGPGGDRIRFAPEFAYAWVGDERDLKDFSNYRVQEEEDPGDYRLEVSADGLSVRLATDTSLVDRRNGASIHISVERTVAPTPPPPGCLREGLRFAGYESLSVLSMPGGSGEGRGVPAGSCVGLWHLLQVPAGDVMILPLRNPAPPLRYFNDGDWLLHDGAPPPFLSWRFGGRAAAKIGYGHAQLSGRAGSIRRRADGSLVLLVLDFPVFPGQSYCDAPAPEMASDQVFQAWDGFGFGELEYHAPAVGPAPLPARWEDRARLWAFDGPRLEIHAVARRLLGVDPDLVPDGGQP